MNRTHSIRLGLVAVLALVIAAGIELLLRARGSGGWLFSFSAQWSAALAVYSVFAGVTTLLIGWELLRPGSASDWYHALSLPGRSLSPVVRLLGAAFCLLLPTLTFLGPWGGSITTPALRMLLFLGSALIAAVLLPVRKSNFVTRLLLSVLISASIFVILKRLVLVTDYPFKLSWSEGNRLWDYSLYFRWEQYGFAAGTDFPTYLTPGRHGLWGLPFLLPDLTIQLARLWDALLWIVPYLLLAWALVSRFASGLSRLTRILLIMWIFLFLTMGGIFAPLILGALLIVWLYQPRRIGRTMLVAFIAGLYAGLSRWTWVLAPAAWMALLVLMSPDRRDSQRERLQQGVAVGIAGAMGGLASQWIIAQAFPRPDPVFSTSLSQPLLWYRMFPNPTNPIGILPGLLIAVGPLLVLLIWAVRRHTVPWTPLEQGLAAITVIVLIGASLAASAKIGGGSNLHNADMLLLTILLLVAMAVSWMPGGGRQIWSQLSEFGRVLVIMALLVPVLDAVRSGGPLSLPSDTVIRNSLAIIQEEAAAATQEGPVLFIDQRQLFTFGQLADVPLDMNYELKDMMNQALGANLAYFEGFRQDLEEHRFALIVSDPLPSALQGRGHQFGEENDAWLTYVAEPLRTYYEPYLVLDEVGAWLLRPPPD